jgi:hypothetical protein
MMHEYKNAALAIDYEELAFDVLLGWPRGLTGLI